MVWIVASLAMCLMVCRTETPPRVRLDIDLWHRQSPTATGFAEEKARTPTAPNAEEHARLFGRVACISVLHGALTSLQCKHAPATGHSGNDHMFGRCILAGTFWPEARDYVRAGENADRKSTRL